MKKPTKRKQKTEEQRRIEYEAKQEKIHDKFVKDLAKASAAEKKATAKINKITNDYHQKSGALRKKHYSDKAKRSKKK